MKPLNMRSNETQGFLLTFCGLDGCGKTTMMERLITDLKKEHKIFVTKQPTDAVRNSNIFRTYMDSPDIDNNIIFTCGYEIENGEIVPVEIFDKDEYSLIGEAV